MKRFVAIILMLFLLPGLYGCSVGESPKDVANNFLTALQQTDFEKASALVENAEMANEFQQAMDAEEGKAAKAMLSKIAFELGKAEESEDKATVEAKITSLDVGRIVANLMKELMPMTFASVFSDEPDTEEKTQEAVDQYIMNAINDPNAPKTTTEVKINLVKTKDGWKIAEDNEKMLSALVGNVDKLFDF